MILSLVKVVRFQEAGIISFGRLSRLFSYQPFPAKSHSQSGRPAERTTMKNKITAETTYSELKAMVPDARGTKMQGRTLVRSDEPILISVKQDSAKITVYENGFFAYQDDQGRVTARAVWNCTEMIFEQAVGRAQSISEDIFGELPFPVVLSHFGEENFEEQRKKDKRASYGISLDAEGTTITEELQTPDFADDVCKRLDEKANPEESEIFILNKALSSLTERQREVFLLYHGDELTQEQIAEKLGTSRPNITKILKSAERRIKKNSK